MVKHPGWSIKGNMHRQRHNWLTGSSPVDPSESRAPRLPERGLPRRLTQVAVLLGLMAALVGAGHLAAWLGGYLSQRGLSVITMKTNAALCLTLVGGALILLVPTEAGSTRRWIARACAALALLLGSSTLAENLAGWDFGIDQLLAVETPGALAATAPNRMGVPASLSFTLIGLALLVLGRRDHRGVGVAQALALAVCLIALLPTIGFLYGAKEFYGIARYTGIAWPTAVSLLLLGLGLLGARPAEGLMVHVTAHGPGGVTLRRLLPVFVVLPLLLGWLRLVGERAGVFDAATGTAMMVLTFISIFSALAYHTGRSTNRAAEALRESEGRLALAASGTQIGMYDSNVVTGEAVWTEQVSRLLGLRTTTISQRYHYHDWARCVHPDDLPRVQAAERRCMVERLPYEMEYRVVWPDGSVHWLADRGIFQYESDVCRTRMLGILMDITDRKQAEETLQQSQKTFAELIERAPFGIYVVDSQFRIAQMNTGSQNGAFRNVRPVLGRDFSEAMRILWPEEVAAQIIGVFRHTLQTGEPYSSPRFTNPRADVGITESYEWELHRMTLPDGRYGVICYYYDSTKLRETEAALRDLNATLESKVAQRTEELTHRAKQLQKLTLELAQAEERERRRIAVILHEDLQQQMAGAKFHLSLVKGRATDARMRAGVEEVDAMLRDAIEQSRSLSRDLSPAVVHMNDLAEVLQWLAHRVRTQQGLSVQVKVLGDVMLHSETLAMFLFRAAQEMLFNVVKHAQVREAALRLRRIGRGVCLRVSDQGRGFDPRELTETAGVGLFSIRERAAFLGGRMKVKSAAGRGSRFTIVVPDGPPAEDGRPKTENGTQEGEDGAPSSALRPPSSDGAVRVLLVDDHDMVRAGLAALLREAPGVELIGEAPDGRKAIDMAVDLRPDVVIMDVSMPFMGGDEATRQIKTYLPHTRVIALSMYDEAEKKQKMFAAGAEGYILKTVSAEELLGAIRGKDALS